MARRTSFPWKEYWWAPGLVAAFSASWFALQQWAQAQIWWSSVPWLMIVGALIFFILGTVYADLWNKQSQLRRWWVYRRRVFDVTFYPASEFRDSIELQTPYFLVRFIVPITDHSLELILYEHLQWSFNKTPQLLLRIDAAKFSEGEEVRVPIATIVREGFAPIFWGDGTANKAPIRGTGNLIEVRAVKNGRVKQRYSVFISYREHETETSNLYSFLQEDRHVFGP